MSENLVTIRLTQKQAKIIWGIIDGAQDAGSCDDGLSAAEHAACARVIDQILPHLNKPERP